MSLFSFMNIFLAALFLIFSSGLAALLFGGNRKLSILTGTAGVVLGSVLGIIPVIKVLITGTKESFYMDWPVPFGSFCVELDTISAFFLLCIFILSFVSAVYGSKYIAGYKHKQIGPTILFFNLLVVSMAVVVVAGNAMMFLICWEMMSLASFFLVTFEDEKKNVRQAGWIYLAATHIGTAFLLAAFILLGRAADSLDFEKIAAGKSLLSSTASIIFILSLIGFGTKAGLVPFHIWLPEAHPAAPSHVSALMSGVMIKTGIYGIIRILTFLPTPPLWWGWLLIIIGAVSGIFGVLLALAKHDIKRLLAYSSVENIGIITLGLGLGMVGITTANSILSILGFGGAILHILNHTLFKGLLFLAAGSIIHAAGTREIDELGGLGKKMPVTSATFLIGAVAICGIPPLNGFISEFLIYFGAFQGVISRQLNPAVLSIVIIGSLALIGGLALACFTKVFGIVFLGQPRSRYAQKGHETEPAMQAAMIILAIACGFVGLFAPLVLKLLSKSIAVLAQIEAIFVEAQITPICMILTKVSFISFCFLAVVAVLWIVRKKIVPNGKMNTEVTWDCGYAKPDVKMQYTASSFAQPLLDTFKMILRTRKNIKEIKGIFPVQQEFESDTPELSRDYLFGPAFKAVYSALDKLRWVQHGNIQLYILYIALTLVILMIWKLT